MTFSKRIQQQYCKPHAILGPNVFCGLRTHGLVDSRTRTGDNFTAGMLCSLPILHMQQFSKKPGTATGVVEEL